MSYKTQVLTESEILVNDADLFYDALVNYCKETGKNISTIRVLDWGCGRGRYVGFLLSKGIDAYGIDIDPVVIAQCQPLFDKRGWDHSKRIKLIGHDNVSPFENEYFDYVFSDQVFEHVRDIHTLCAELHRISKKSGLQIHRFPAKYRVIEPHLFMPYVHWIPKGIMRYLMILIYVSLKIEPKWKELDSKKIAEKAMVYYRYSKEKTFYRHLFILSRVLRGYFSSVILQSYFYSGNKIINKLASNSYINNQIGLNFHSVTIRLIK